MRLGSPCPRKNLRELQFLCYDGIMSNFSFQVKSELAFQKQNRKDSFAFFDKRSQSSIRLNYSILGNKYN